MEEYLPWLIGIATIFGLIGFWRGLGREGFKTIVILTAIAIARWGQMILIRWTNRLHKVALFALRGGLVAEDPAAVWTEVRKLPPLVETEREKLIFILAFFGLVVFVAYVIDFSNVCRPWGAFGPMIFRRRPTWSMRLLGLVLGLINGYLIVYFVIPHAFPEVETVIKLPSGTIAEFLGTNLPFVFIGLVVTLIVIGLGGASKK